MARMLVVTESNTKERIWHAAKAAGTFAENKAVCGVKGDWDGLGFIVTCPQCAEKVGTDPMGLTIRGAT